MRIICLIFSFLFININSNAQDMSTNWKIEPSFKYDALCFVNIMTGDSFYLSYFNNEYEEFKDKLTEDVKKDLASIRQKIKIENNTIISAWLCLYFSAVEDSTLDDMVNTLENTEKLKENFKQSPYWSDEGWEMFESINPELKNIFSFLKQIEFPQYWTDNIKPKIDTYIKTTEADLPKYDVIKENEYYLGYKLPSDTITVYVLYFAKPHGIKITGTRFLTDVAWPFQIVIRTAAHEMMHPPYDIKNNTALKEALDKFKADEFLMDKVLNHNPSFGYNSFEGFIEEDCVQALDEVINEKLGVAKDARQRWKTSDDGMHVFAIALYQVMKEENYNTNNEIFSSFLIRIINEEKLKPGMIKEYYEKFYK